MSAPEPGSWTIAALDMGPPHRRRRGLRRGGGRRARHRSMARREGGCWVAGRLRPGTAPRRAPRRAERAAGAAPRVGSANHDRGINGAPLHIPPARRWMPSHSLMAGGGGCGCRVGRADGLPESTPRVHLASRPRLTGRGRPRGTASVAEGTPPRHGLLSFGRGYNDKT